jgi:alpha-galactosidase
VVDGGWFPGGFRRGIGNWERPDPSKFPGGFEPFVEFVEAQGMRFGTWFEPEYAHRDSALVRAKPDWFLPGPATSVYSTPRNWQYQRAESEYMLMDFGLPEVRDHWLETIRRAYQQWHVRWVRWDFNQQPRPHWDSTEDSALAQSRHLRGLYEVLDAVIAEMPDLVIEQCASGGHRIDLATARRGHTYWMNDHTSHTDIVRRLQTRLNGVLPGNYANTNLCQPRHDFSTTTSCPTPPAASGTAVACGKPLGLRRAPSRLPSAGSRGSVTSFSETSRLRWTTSPGRL